MKDSVLDVLMYLFETYIDVDDEIEPDHNQLRSELEGAGFGDREIDRALDWLEGLADQNAGTEAGQTTGEGGDGDGGGQEAPLNRSIRVYSRYELTRFDTECRGYLMYLEQIGILSAVQRELVIDRLLALDEEDIGIDQIKWVVLMVLFSQPGQETAYARMEDLVFEERMSAVH